MYIPKPGPNARFEFGRQYECIKSLEHYKCQTILQAGRQAGLLCSALQNYLSMDFRIRIMTFLIKMSVLSCF